MKFSEVKVNEFFKLIGDDKTYQKVSPFGYKFPPDFAVLGEIQIMGDPEVQVPKTTTPQSAKKNSKKN